MAGVVKATVSMEVFFPADEEHRFRNMSLDDILYEVSEGTWIGGSPMKGETVEIPREELRSQLEAIGNDGSFFDDVDVEDLERGYGA